MVIVEGTHQPPMQPSHGAIYCLRSLFSIGTTYIVPTSTIQGAGHLLLLTPQPSSTWWYLSINIDSDSFNEDYVWLIRFDA